MTILFTMKSNVLSTVNRDGEKNYIDPCCFHIRGNWSSCATNQKCPNKSSLVSGKTSIKAGFSSVLVLNIQGCVTTIYKYKYTKNLKKQLILPINLGKVMYKGCILSCTISVVMLHCSCIISCYYDLPFFSLFFSK